ncbi:hypothetical protein PG994_006513 [Apiospora phragmitis]|uniref:Berberine/berberine-like domain-containing protein n=1 Tax=Apiospora phragmitis TaxID=2905665 RepID=A0ABR1VFF0_9PEZI
MGTDSEHNADPATEEDEVFTRADRVFGPNIQRLREHKVKYDPNNVFKNLEWECRWEDEWWAMIAPLTLDPCLIGQ